MRRTIELPKSEYELDEMDVACWLKLNRSADEICTIAIDPGDVHIGVSIGIISPVKEQSVLAYSLEMERRAALEFVQDALSINAFDLLVVEDFRLIPSMAAAQAGSPMLTARMIGAFEWMVTQHYRIYLDKADQHIIMFQQPPTIKKTMRALLQKYAIKPTPCGNSGHARDSQLHFWYRAFKTEGIIS